MQTFLKRISICVTVPIFLLVVMIVGGVVIYTKLAPVIKKSWTQNDWGWNLFKLEK